MKIIIAESSSAVLAQGPETHISRLLTETTVLKAVCQKTFHGRRALLMPAVVPSLDNSLQ